MLQQLLLCSLLFILPIHLSAQVTTNNLTKAEEKQEKKFLKNDLYVKIPAGILQKDTSAQSEATTIAMSSFFMLSREVTNFDYKEFLYYFKTRDTAKYNANLLDSTVWRTKNSFMEPMVNLYSNHPAYQHYPVVGVTYNQAKAYCEWLTDIVNNNEGRIFKKVLYRLPSEDEWIYAANGGNEDATYPWAGTHLLTADGEYKANCVAFNPENVYRDTLYEKDENGNLEEVIIYRTHPGGFAGERGILNDAADLTAVTTSYWPNAFGLYNMAGNVAEMVAEQGITHGGSWKDPGYYLQNNVKQYYSDVNRGAKDIGFRYIMEVIEY